MKIIHTSDWHLGHRLHEQLQHEEQTRFLDWLHTYISENEIDVLLVSGDVFDTGVPSTQSQKLYYDFLVRLQSTPCQEVIITGGNHDAPGTLNAPKELLNALSVRVVGKASEDISEEVFVVEKKNEQLIVAAVPYLRDQDIRKAVAGETFEQIGDRYKQALVRHYEQVAKHCAGLKTQNSTLIAMGHLFAIGGNTSDSEQSIYVGNLGDIGAEDFPAVFDYVALGHLHRPQMVNKQDRIRYSGSPYPLSFSEAGHNKKIVLIETNANKIERIKEVDVPLSRKLYQIEGALEENIARLQNLSIAEDELTPWVELVLDPKQNPGIRYNEVHAQVAGLNVEVLKISFKDERELAGLEKLVESSRHIKELSPMDVFTLKCKEQDFDLEARPEILDAFSEVLEIVKES